MFHFSWRPIFHFFLFIFHFAIRRSVEVVKERRRKEGGKGEKEKKEAGIMNQKLYSIDQSLLTTTAYAI
jgi:hypothetical protein